MLLRRWLAAGLGLGVLTSAVAAQSPAGRPAVRLVGVRAADAPADAARGQSPMPAPALPQNSVPLGVPRPIDGPSPGPVVPSSGGIPSPFGSPFGPGDAIPVGGPVTVGPAVPLAGPAACPPGVGYPGHPPIFATPNLDQPLYDGTGGLAVGPAAGLLCRPPQATKWWVSAEYLGWWTKSAKFPALLTTSSLSTSTLDRPAGALGDPATRVLFGDRSFGQTLHGGGRFGVGYWFSDNQVLGLEGNVFYLGRNGETFLVPTGSQAVLARPFTNANTNAPFSQLVALPGLATGGAAVTYDSQVWGAEANVRRRLTGTACTRLDLLAGFRYLNVNEDLRITETFSRVAGSNTAIGDPTAAGGVVFDRFRTENHFFGGQVGLQGEVRRGRWYTNLAGKVGLGTVFQTVEITGGQSLNLFGGGTATTAGGLLAVPGANLGTFTRNKFAVVPEVQFQVGYHLTPYWRLFVGYNFLYLSDVLRPGDQIDPAIDVTRIPNFPLPAGNTRLNTVRPTVPFKESDFFTQGISFGMQFTW